MISLAWVECRLPVGSSASSSGGLWITARAMPTSCCCPPESWLGYRSFLATIWKRSRVSATRLCRWLARNVLIRKRQIDVLLHGEVVEQVVALEDHADILLRQFSPLLALQVVNALFAKPVLALPLVVEKSQHVEERGLPCSRWSHHSDELAFANVEVHAAQHPGSSGASFVTAIDIFQLDHFTLIS